MARTKRPILDRDGPIRSWASTVNPEPQKAAKDTAHPNPEPRLDDKDPIVRGVVSGGRVVDEWIRQAQQTARMLGGTASTAGWADASGRIFRAGSDLMAAWWSVMGGLQPNGGAGFVSPPPGSASHQSAWQARTPPDPVQTAEPSAEERTSPPSTGPRVRLEVASRVPVEVTVDLHRRGVTRFRVLDLRPERDDAPRIQGTELEPWDLDGVHLRLTVPDDQPPGVYHAVVLDAVADCAIGTVTLRIRG